MPLTDFIPWYEPDPYADLVEGLDTALGDGDAVALMPYDDGTIYPKRAYFDKHLIGGVGGYETEDGDKIAVDGTGEAVRSLFGVDIVLAVDPTEHAAAVDPMKALIAHKEDIGEWLRVDKQGTVVQAGPAVRPAPAFVHAEDVDDAFERAPADDLLALLYPDYDPGRWTPEEKEAEIDEREAELREAIEAELEAIAEPPIDVDGKVADGGMAGELMAQSANDPERPSLSFTDALAELADRDAISKVYDIAPPTGLVLDEEGNVELDEATHIAVDQSKAANLLPTTIDTVELNTALDKARMEEHEEGKLMQYFVYGLIAGALIVGIMGLAFVMLFSITGGVF